MIRRLLLIVLALVLLPACVAVKINDNDQGEPKPRPTARSQSGGVEVWNLQDAPSRAAFGIPEDEVAGIYETQQPRTVRLELPDAVTLTVEATLVTFEQFGDTGRFTVGIRTAQLKPDVLVATYRDVLEQLSVSTAVADTLAAEIAGAPRDQTERINVGSDTVTLGDLRIGAQAGLAPIAGSGRVIIGGSWQGQ